LTGGKRNERGGDGRWCAALACACDETYQLGGRVGRGRGREAIRRSQQGSVLKQVFEGGGISGVVGVE